MIFCRMLREIVFFCPDAMVQDFMDACRNLRRHGSPRAKALCLVFSMPFFLHLLLCYAFDRFRLCLGPLVRDFDGHPQVIVVVRFNTKSRTSSEYLRYRLNRRLVPV
jgi:hypothetical protein